MMGQAIDEGAEIETLEGSLGFAFKQPDGSVEWVDRVETGKLLTESGQLTGLKPGEAVTSEHIRNEVPGVTFTPEPQQAPKITQDKAAETLQPFFNEAVEVARKAGADDPDIAASKAQDEIAKQVASGTTTLDNPRALFMKAARLQGLKQSNPVAEAVEEPEAVTERGPRAEAVSQEAVQSIQDVVSSMPDNDRKVMEALMESSRTDEQLSKDLGMTVDQVKKAKSRGREALRQFIKKQGIGEKLGPGAANQREFDKARYLIAADIYQELKGIDSLSKTAFEDRMSKYEDVFTEEQVENAWAVAVEAGQQFEESGGRKPLPVILDQLMGAKPGEGVTAIKNAQADKERAARGLPPAVQVARRADPQLWDETQRYMEDNKQAQAELIERLKANPRSTVNDLELMMLLDAKIKEENRYSELLDRVNNPENEQAKLASESLLRSSATRLTELYDMAKVVGTEQARAFRARRLLVQRDFSIQRLRSELQASKGEKLTREEQQFAQDVSQKATEAQSALETRIDTLEEQESQKAFDSTVKEMQGAMPFDSKILAIANKIVAKLDAAADKARARIRARLGRLNMGLDPTLFADYAIIGASKIAHGLRDAAWKVAMRSELEGVDYEEGDLNTIYQQSNQQIDAMEEEVPEPQRKSVKEAVRKKGSKDTVDDLKKKIRDRIEDGESISDLRSYIQKMALAFVRSGINEPGPLLEAVHGAVAPIVKDITPREVRDLISGYGDYKQLDADSAKATLRDVKGQYQQTSKLEDIQSKEPLKKTGVERRKPSDAERRLIREVNEAKKKYGVVVTDPETQLKSALDSIKTGLRNQLRDLTHQIETGEKPIAGTPAPTDEQIESLKALRDRVRQTLKDIEGKPEVSQEQRIRSAEQALERSISDLEERIKNKDTSTIVSEKPQSEKLTALRAQRDALRADLDALKQADQDLQDTKTFDRLMKQAAELQNRLDRGDVQPKTKAEKIEDDLVKQARAQVQALQAELQEARNSTPEAEQARLNAAIAAVERSIASYDARLKSGDVAPSEKAPRVSSPILERLRAERDAMRKLVSELRKAPPLSPEEKGIKMLKARLARQISDLETRIANGDFAKKIRKPLDISKDPEAVRLTAERNKVMNEFRQKRDEFEKSRLSDLEKVYGFVRDRANDAKSSVGSVDLSAFARQAAKATASHPIIAFKNLITSITAMNEKKLNEVNSKLELRPNAQNGKYQLGKVQFTDLNGPLSKQEEAFRSTLARKIPWIKWSERQYGTFLNLMRADVFDMMVAASPVELTPEQLRAIGRSVNIATGRGELGKWGSGAADALSTFFWSPRLYVSRLQTLVGYDVWQKDAKGVRKIILKEYIRAASSGMAIVALGILAGADIEWDKTSSDFLKLRFGNTRVDPWGGIQQWMVFLSRILSAQYKTSKGKKFDMTYPDKRPGPYDPTYDDTMMRMIRSKLNPITGAIWDYRQGRDIQGREVTGVDATLKAMIPLSVFNDDIVPIAKEHGLGAAAAAEMLNLLGVGVQSYEDDRKEKPYFR